MTDKNFCYISDLQYRNRVLEHELEQYRSGEKYAQHKKAENDLAKANPRLVDMRKKWLEVLEDVQNEYERKIREKDKELAAMEQRALDAERKVDELQDKVTQQRRGYYDVAGKLEDAEEKIQKLTAQVNKDFENSSIPSSEQGAGRKYLTAGRKAQ